MNIIPKKAAISPNYWCTWSTQNYETNTTDKGNICPLDFPGDQGNIYARDSVNELVLFKKDGWLDQLKEIQEDLYFLIDDGWDVPYNTYPSNNLNVFGSLELSTERFPSFTGEPKDRLKKLNDKIIEKGWRGVGLWLAAQNAGKLLPYNSAEMKSYWLERISWCKYAGVEYWKVDWGEYSHNGKFRKLLTDLAKENYPELIIEHSFCSGPINNYSENMDKNRFTDWKEVYDKSIEFTKFSQVFRSYDVTAQLSIPTTIDRIVSLFTNNSCVINCEDELYMGAALGCTIGIMRSNHWITIDGMDYDPWHQHMRMNEAIRAINWQRIAPAFASDKIQCSDIILSDTWYFNEGDSWFNLATGKTLTQSAPSIVARNMELPKITTIMDLDKLPYVVSARNPNGAVSVATLGRIINNTIVHNTISITIELDEIPEFLGLFSQFDLEIVTKSKVNINQVYAQDLSGTIAYEISNEIIVSEKTILLKNDIFLNKKFYNNQNNDFSDRGIVLKFL